MCSSEAQNNIEDALSRLNRIPTSERCRYDDEHVRMVTFNAIPVALKIQETEKASTEDEELRALRNCFISGDRGSVPNPYAIVRNELSFIGQVILRGKRIVKVNHQETQKLHTSRK